MTDRLYEKDGMLREMTATVGALQGVMQAEEECAVELPSAQDGEI